MITCDDSFNRNQVDDLDVESSISQFEYQYSSLDIFSSKPNQVAYAAFSGDVSSFIQLTQKGVAAIDIDLENRSAIHFAAAGGNISMMSLLIDDYKQLLNLDNFNRTAFHYSCQYDQYEMAKFLIDKYIELNEDDGSETISAIINQPDICGMTALHFAVENSNEHLVQLLINHCANINSTDSDGCTPLHYASKAGSVEIFTLFLEHGAQLKKKSKNGWNLLHFGAFSSSSLMIAKIMEVVYIDPNAPDRFNRIPLHYACETGSINVVSSLLQLGSHFSHQDIDGRAPIHFAAMSGNESLVKLLVKLGSPIYINDFSGQNPLHLACSSGSVNTVRFLCNRYKKMMNQDSKNGSTALHYSSSFNSDSNKTITEFLLSKGIDVNKQNKFGITPLHCAAQNGCAKTAGTLTQFGADINVLDKSSRSPLDVAIFGNEKEIVDLLVDKGAPVSRQSSAAYSRMSSANVSPCPSPKLIKMPIDVSLCVPLILDQI